MRKKLRCKLGWHKWKWYEEWFPDIQAEKVDAVIFGKVCSRCGSRRVIDKMELQEDIFNHYAVERLNKRYLK